MRVLLIIGSVVAAVYLFLRLRNDAIRHAAAQNIVVAKHTFHLLPENDQLRVKEHAENLVNGLMHGRFEGFNGEIDKYGFYALAMAELNIPSAIREFGWNYVRNPFTAVLPKDKNLEIVTKYFKYRYHINISISNDHRLFDKMRASKKQER